MNESNENLAGKFLSSFDNKTDDGEIDLRSDTVTKPTAGMRWAMANAEVGDDVFNEDPSVLALQEQMADLTGKEAALFVPTATQSNLISLLTHCQRGEEYIAGQMAHIFRWEAGGGAVLGGITPQPLDFLPDGTLDLTAVKNAIKPDDCHFARTRLLALENTQGGKVLPLEYLKSAVNFAKGYSLNLHLDGARVFNAAAALGVPVSRITEGFDTITTCLSKGLGAPAGALLCGTKEMTKRAHRWRKMVGGSMRQSGVLAAAGIYALNNNVNRLIEDHNNAQLLAKGLMNIQELQGKVQVHTNMVFVDVGARAGTVMPSYMKEHGIRILGSDKLRLVTHLGISAADIHRAIAAFASFFQKSSHQMDSKDARPSVY